MSNKPKLILKELDKFINTKAFNQYIKDGFTFHYDLYTFDLLITYSSKEYVVNLVVKDGQYQWRLTPYNNSFFETSINNGLDIVIFAIKENENLYVRKEIN